MASSGPPCQFLGMGGNIPSLLQISALLHPCCVVLPACSNVLTEVWLSEPSLVPLWKTKTITVSIRLEHASRYVHGFNLVCGTFAHHWGRRFSLFVNGCGATVLDGLWGGSRDLHALTCMRGRLQLCKQKGQRGHVTSQSRKRTSTTGATQPGKKVMYGPLYVTANLFCSLGLNRGCTRAALEQWRNRI